MRKRTTRRWLSLAKRQGAAGALTVPCALPTAITAILVVSLLEATTARAPREGMKGASERRPSRG